MDFGLSEEQEMLRTIARDFLTKQCPKTMVRNMLQDKNGYSPELWAEMASLGWMGLAFPSEYGGSNMTFLDLAVLLEETGRACLPGPFFSSVILGGLSLLGDGSEKQKSQYLRDIAGGKIIFTLAYLEPSIGYDAAGITVKAVAEKDDYIISGIKIFVPDAHLADYLLCVARTSQEPDPKEGITIFIVQAKQPDVTIRQLKTYTANRLCEVSLNQVKVHKENIIGVLGQGWEIIQRTIERAAVGKCCEMVGALQTAFEMTLGYAKERKQFDHFIGSFQVIQHYLADMVISIDSLRFITYKAAWMVKEGLPVTQEIAMAKLWASEVSRQITTLSHQIHGAIGFTWDHDLHLYTKHIKAAEVAYGGSEFYKTIVANYLMNSKENRVRVS